MPVTVTCPAGEILGENSFFDSVPYAQARPFEEAVALSPERIDARTHRSGLFLSISTPEARLGADAPVIVYIYGNSFQPGQRQTKESDPELFVEQGFVVVSVDYRNGLDGFMPCDGDTPGHFRGVDDCGLALAWVQKNIDYFGGDPTNVTLLGHSAGAAIALWLTRKDHYKGEFRRVVALSPAFPRQDFADRRRTFKSFFRKPLTPDSLSHAKPSSLDRVYRWFSFKYFSDLPFGPSPYDPEELADVPLIISSARQEMYGNALGKRLNRYKFTHRLVARLLDVKYPSSYINGAKQIDDRIVGQMIGDSFIRRWVAATEKGWWVEFSGSHNDSVRWVFQENSPAHRIVADFASGKMPEWPQYDEKNRLALAIDHDTVEVVRDPLRLVRVSFAKI